NPDIARLVDIGDSYEKKAGLGGYDIWAIKISDHVQIEEDEPEVFFFANIHARELITPEIIMYFLHYLIDHYGKDGYVTHLINNRQIWLCPSANPDGHEYCLSGNDPSDANYPANPAWWRKNKSDNDGDGKFDPYKDGVDLNRNFGYKWGYDEVGSSANPVAATYRGKSAFSEPESQAIRDFVMQHRFLIALSFHSHGQLWLYPWGYTSERTPDYMSFRWLAGGCVAYNNYNPQAGYQLYPTNGTTDDWLYGEQTLKNKIFAFYNQFGFFPDTMYMKKQILENQGPMLYLAYAAGEEPIISHTPMPEQTEFFGPFPIITTIGSPVKLTTTSPIDHSATRLFFKIGNAVAFDSVMMMPTERAGEFRAEIPELQSETTVYYYLQAADQKNLKATLPIGAPLAFFSFDYVSDMTAPVIKHQPIDHGSISASEFLIRAEVTDNVKVDRVWLVYRKNRGELDSLVMTQTGKKDEVFAAIPADGLQPGDLFEYQIIAGDIARTPNIAQAPDAGYFKFYIRNTILFDFEKDASFLATAGGDWQWGVPTSGPQSSFSGSKLWATNLQGNYSNLKESILETPEMQLSGQDSSRLVFWHWYENEYSDNTCWDGGNVKISVDGGPFQVITPEGGYDGFIDPYAPFMAGEPCFGGKASNGNFWHKEVFDLTEFLNHRIKIRFHFAADRYSSKPGWYIDFVEFLLERTTPVAGDRLAIQPDDVALDQNYPNPFNPATVIHYTLSHSNFVTLEIFNVLGQKVVTLVDEFQTAGAHQISWEGVDDWNRAVPSGVYFSRLTIGAKRADRIQIKKMLKLK
ncbi:MAG: T9SS type A sorting domain-containing protein, partial [bacterium]|nr:T9SS type A sorting domain-containing protein [bacterium]